MEKNLYCNHSGIILDIPKNLRDELVELQKLDLVRQAKRLLNIVSLLLVAKSIFNKYYI